MVNQNIYLANIIYLFHIIIILFIILAPLINNPLILILHITFSLCLFIHWICNSDICFLTLLECQLRGVSQNNSFIYQFINPIYNISSYKYTTMIWIITLIMFFISIYKLYYSKNIRNIIKYYNNIDSIFNINHIKNMIIILSRNYN